MAQHRRGRLLAIESDVCVCVCAPTCRQRRRRDLDCLFASGDTHANLSIIDYPPGLVFVYKSQDCRSPSPCSICSLLYTMSSHILFFFALFFSTCRHDLVSCARTKLYGDPVACSTTTVTKCQAGLRTLQAFPVFHPTCLCREPSVDPDCNAFRDSLFDHPCMVSKQKGNTVTCLSLCWPAFID